MNKHVYFLIRKHFKYNYDKKRRGPKNLCMCGMRKIIKQQPSTVNHRKEIVVIHSFFLRLLDSKYVFVVVSRIMAHVPIDGRRPLVVGPVATPC